MALAMFGASVSTVSAAVPFPMSSGNYSENFNDIANWTNNFASGIGAQYWSPVGVNATGTIPDGVRITVSTATFVSGTAGGVQRGSGNTQLLSTNATDNLNADAIDLLLDFTGVTAGTLSYDFATVFNSTGNRNGSLRVYTSNDGVAFTELTAASVVDFQNNVAFSKQISLVQLPASFTNSPTARIRFYDYNGTGPSGSSGARPKASIDNLVVTVQSPVLGYTVTGTGGGSGSAPVITSVYEASDSTLLVFFNVAVDSATSQTPGNYNVGGLGAVNAVRDPIVTSQVTITVRSIPAGDRTLTVNGVGDLAAHYTSNATFGFHFVDVSIPAGYYDSAIGQRGSVLLITLHNIIRGHTALSYSSTATAFQHTDKRPDGNVWDVYSDVPGGTPPYEYAFGPLGSGGSEGIAYNSEHSFPQSWFAGSVLAMYSDVWVIYPTDSKVNSERGNFPYGKIGTATWTSLNGTKLGNCVSPGYSATCFEPIDGYKGDLARSQFYVATRYFNEDGSWPGGASTSKSQPLKWAADQYLQWSIDDAVSWKERVRNAAIYEYQHNRNPFVDHPDFASAIYDSTNVTGVDPLADPPQH